MRAYDLDISLQYIDAGFRVYVASAEIEHFADRKGGSTRRLRDYLQAIEADDDEYYERTIDLLREKWGHLLPLTREFKDRTSTQKRIDDLLFQLDRLAKWSFDLEREAQLKEKELSKASGYARSLEREYFALKAEPEKVSAWRKSLKVNAGV